jgi:glucosamine-6-phosphate deaminase
MEKLHYDKMPVEIYDTNAEMGAAAAFELAAILKRAVAVRDHAAVILASANSQLTFIDTLARDDSLPWQKISILHMDEYLGISENHPASFRRFIHDHLVSIVKPYAFYGIQGETSDVEAEMNRYTELIGELQPAATVLGFGENAHLAFNDPPADFNTSKLIHVVALAEASRQQQVGEGHFSTMAEVPTHALSLTVPALLKPAYVLAIVPERRKAEAVKRSLEGPVTPDCPASILRTRSNTRLYLDAESASLLQNH